MVKYTLNILRKGYVLSQAFFSWTIKEGIEEGNKLQDWFDVLIEATKHWKFGDETTTPWLFLRCYVSVNNFLVLLFSFFKFFLWYMSWETCLLIRFISHFWSKINTRVGKHFFWAREQIHVILLTGRDLCFYNQTNQIKFKTVLIVKFSSWFLYTWIEQWVWIILM